VLVAKKISQKSTRLKIPEDSMFIARNLVQPFDAAAFIQLFYSIHIWPFLGLHC